MTEKDKIDPVSYPDAVVKAVDKSEKPFLSVNDLGEILSVNRRSVLNHIDEIKDDERLSYDEVSKTTVFWLNDD